MGQAVPLAGWPRTLHHQAGGGGPRSPGAARLARSTVSLSHDRWPGAWRRRDSPGPLVKQPDPVHWALARPAVAAGVPAMGPGGLWGLIRDLPPRAVQRLPQPRFSAGPGLCLGVVVTLVPPGTQTLLRLRACHPPQPAGGWHRTLLQARGPTWGSKPCSPMTTLSSQLLLPRPRHTRPLSRDMQGRCVPGTHVKNRARGPCQGEP